MFEIDKPKNAKELALSRLQSVRMRAHSAHINGYVRPKADSKSFCDRLQNARNRGARNGTKQRALVAFERTSIIGRASPSGSIERKTIKWLRKMPRLSATLSCPTERYF